MIRSQLNPERISLVEVAKFFGNSTKNLQPTKIWLQENGVPYTATGIKKGVSKWIFDFALQIKMVEDLKIIFPSTWHLIYEAGATDKKMVEAVFVLHPPERKPSKNKLNKSEYDYLK